MTTALTLRKWPTPTHEPRRLDDPNHRDVLKIISVDGGGIRGLMPLKVIQELIRLTAPTSAAAVEATPAGTSRSSSSSFEASAVNLDETERKLQAEWADAFDYFVGTSTGALVTFCVAVDYPLSQLEGLYKDTSFFAHSPWKRPPSDYSLYNADRLEKHINKVIEALPLRDDIASIKTLGDVHTYMNAGKSNPRRLVLTTYDCTNDQVIFFDSGNTNDHKYPIVQIIRATAAAPIYFPVAKVKKELDDDTARICVDGGVCANDPAIAGLWVARRNYFREQNEKNVQNVQNEQNEQNEKDEKDEKDKKKQKKKQQQEPRFAILSLGTGAATTSNYVGTMSGGFMSWMTNKHGFLVSIIMEATAKMYSMIANSFPTRDVLYCKINFTSKTDLQLNDTSFATQLEREWARMTKMEDFVVGKRFYEEVIGNRQRDRDATIAQTKAEAIGNYSSNMSISTGYDCSSCRRPITKYRWAKSALKRLCSECVNAPEFFEAPLTVETVDDVEQFSFSPRPLSPTQKLVKILCFDGGGALSLFGIEALMEIIKQTYEAENYTLELQKQWIDERRFDYFVGSSTGGIVAFCVATGMDLERFKERITQTKFISTNKYVPSWASASYHFVRDLPMYDDQNLFKIIDEIIAEAMPCYTNPTLRQLHEFINRKKQDPNEPDQRVVMHAYDASASKIIAFNSSYRPHWDYHVSDVIKAATAVPIAMKPYKFVLPYRFGTDRKPHAFIDGSIINSDPEMVAVWVARMDHRDERIKCRIVAFGTGRYIHPERLDQLSDPTGYGAGTNSWMTKSKTSGLRFYASFLRNASDLIDAYLLEVMGRSTSSFVETMATDWGAFLSGVERCKLDFDSRAELRFDSLAFADVLKKSWETVRRDVVFEEFRDFATAIVTMSSSSATTMRKPSIILCGLPGYPTDVDNDTLSALCSRHAIINVALEDTTAFVDKLKEGNWDGVIIGNGVDPHPNFHIFQKQLIGSVRTHAPTAMVMFNKKAKDIINFIKRSFPHIAENE